MAWQRHAGNQAAQALIAAYPTPRALRQALDDNGTAIISAEVRGLSWNADTTIGGVLASAAFQRRDVATLHAILCAHAREQEIWTAPDGTQTVRAL